jgi:hypothetical protein
MNRGIIASNPHPVSHRESPSGSDEEDLVVGSEDGAGELGLGSSSADSKAAAGAPRGPAFIATSGSKSQLITASKATDAKATSVAALTSAASKETTAGNRTAGGKQTTAAIRGGAQGAGIGKVTIPAENSGGGGFPAANRNITKTAAGAKTLGLVTDAYVALLQPYFHLSFAVLFSIIMISMRTFRPP